MFELFSDIYFIVYKLYYIGQNDNLGIRARLKNWDEGSSQDFTGGVACSKNKESSSLNLRD
jgi:hypothetical protein